MMEGRSPMTLAESACRKPIRQSDTWLSANWEEFSAIATDPNFKKASCYYYKHQMRIEALSVGPNHASTHCLIHLIVILYCSSKGIPVQGLLRASYRKAEQLEAQPDCSYFIHQLQRFSNNNDYVDLNTCLAPALAIEIAANSLKDDLGLKRLLYEERGFRNIGW
jgi:Uma2 family endonuclease